MNGQPDLFSMVRPSDPETSRAAALSTDTAKGEAKVMGVLTRWPDEAHTDHEIADLAGMDKGSASVRRKACERKGWVEWAGTFGLTPNGCKARRWQVTQAGLEAHRRAA